MEIQLSNVSKIPLINEATREVLIAVAPKSIGGQNIKGVDELTSREVGSVQRIMVAKKAVQQLQQFGG